MVLGLALTASAAAIPTNLIDVNFTGSDINSPGPAATGAAVIGAPGDTWNGLASFPPTTQPAALVAANGVASGVSLSWSSSGSWNAGGSPSPNPALTEAYLYQLGAGGTADLTGLQANQPYKLYLYTQNNDNNDRQTDFTVTGGTVATAQSGVGSQSETAWVQGVNYSVVTVDADAAGDIAISFAPDPNHVGEADFNGIQLTEVPEPSSLVALGGLAVAGVFLTLRRRKA
jgi:hypothetical protein